jgi:hypothetical protein
MFSYLKPSPPPPQKQRAAAHKGRILFKGGEGTQIKVLNTTDCSIILSTHRGWGKPNTLWCLS